MIIDIRVILEVDQKIWKVLIDDSTNYERFYFSQSKPIIRGQVLRGFR